MTDTEPRHQLFQHARSQADWSVQQLWLGYLALGGTRDAFDIEAYLHGLGPLSDPEQNVLANTVNERLDDLYLAAKVPYVSIVGLPESRYADPLAVLDDLLAARRPADPDED